MDDGSVLGVGNGDGGVIEETVRAVAHLRRRQRAQRHVVKMNSPAPISEQREQIYRLDRPGRHDDPALPLPARSGDLGDSAIAARARVAFWGFAKRERP